MKRYSTKLLASFALIAGMLFLGQAAYVSALGGGNGPGPCTPDAYNVSGWLWSDGAGWVSLNCSNSASTSAMNFGVYQDQAGFWQGYGWSSNLGWLHFDPNSSDGTSTTGCPSGTGGILKYDGTTNASVCKTQLFDFGSGKKQLVGFARFISSPTASDPEDWSWVSWNCRNDHNFAAAGVQVSPHCGTGANVYGPTAGAPVTGPTGDVSTIKGFAWGRLNVGWMEFRDVTVTTDPDAVDLVLTPSSTTVYSPYSVNLTWTSTKADKFTADKCTAFTRKSSGDPTSVTATNWTGNTNLLPPTNTVRTQTQTGISVPLSSVDYKIQCKGLTGDLIDSNWVTVARGSVPIVLNHQCKDESTVRLSWSYLGSAQSCRLFKDGSRVATNLPRNDGRDVTADGAYDVKCYDPANAADNDPASTSNIESVSIASCAEEPPCSVDTPYATDSACYCIHHGTDALCTTTRIGTENACNIGATPSSQYLSWQAGGGSATTCRIFKGSTLVATDLGLSGTQTPLSSGTYSVKCYATQASPNSPALASTSVNINTTSCDPVRCTAATTYDENSACFCGHHPDDNRCVPIPPRTGPTKPGVTEDKGR